MFAAEMVLFEFPLFWPLVVTAFLIIGIITMIVLIILRRK